MQTTTLVQPAEEAVVSEEQQQEEKPKAEVEQKGPRTETLTLRLVPRRKKKGVKWAEDTEEINEFSGKMKSKKCCIFHKRRVFGDWSDEDSDADCECDPNEPPQPPAQPQHLQV